jgi:hypothetical protein
MQNFLMLNTAGGPTQQGANKLEFHPRNMNKGDGLTLSKSWKSFCIGLKKGDSLLKHNS